MDTPHRITRRAALRATPAVGALALAACAGPGATGSTSGAAPKEARPVTLRWGTDYEVAFHSYVDAALAKFKQQYPQITVQHEATQGQEYYTKLRALLASDSMPDLSVMTTRWSAQWLRGTKGAFKDLDPLVKRDKHDVSDFWSLLLPGFSDEKGHVHILPYDVSVQLLFFNRELLQQEGIALPDASWTLDQLLAAAKRLTQTGADGKTPMWGYDGFQSGGQFEYVVERFGGSLFDEKLSKCTLNSVGSVAGVQWWTDVRHRHRVAPLPTDVTELGGSERGFGTSRTAMLATGTPSVTRIRAFQIEWDVVPIPAGPRGDQLRSGGGGYGIAGKTPHTDEAWLLLKHLTSKETLAEMIGRSGRSIPGRRSVANSSHDASKPPKNWPVAFKEAERAKAISFSLHPRGGDVLDEVNRGLGAIFNNGGDVRAQLDQVTAKVDAILAQQQ